MVARVGNRSFAYWLRQHADLHRGSASVIKDADLSIVGHALPNQVRARVASDLVDAMRRENFNPTCSGNLQHVAEECDSDYGALLDAYSIRMRDFGR